MRYDVTPHTVAQLRRRSSDTRTVDSDTQNDTQLYSRALRCNLTFTQYGRPSKRDANTTHLSVRHDRTVVMGWLHRERSGWPGECGEAVRATEALAESPAAELALWPPSGKQAARWRWSWKRWPREPRARGRARAGAAERRGGGAGHGGASRESREPAADPALGPPSGEMALTVEALADRTGEAVADGAGRRRPWHSLLVGDFGGEVTQTLADCHVIFAIKVLDPTAAPARA